MNNDKLHLIFSIFAIQAGYIFLHLVAAKAVVYMTLITTVCEFQEAAIILTSVLELFC